MKIGKTQLKLLDPIFSQDVRIFLNCENDEYIKFQKKLNVANPDSTDANQLAFTTHITCDNEPNVYVIWIKHFDWSIDDQATLIHELIHLVVRIWEANNIQMIPETQEFFAHSVDKLYSIIAVKLLNKSKKK